MKKKILAIIMMFVLMITSLNAAYAKEGMLDIGVLETAYRLSKEADIELPFLNFFEKSATYDKAVEHSGISFGSTTIDIDDKMEGMHLILSEDMVTIKGEVEHGIIYGGNIVVVEGKITNDTILMANTVKILDTAVIEKDVIIVTTDLVMDGLIKGSLIGVATDATINGTIEQDLRMEVTEINLEKSTVKDEVYVKVPSGTDLTNIKAKYPNAMLKEIEEFADEEEATKLSGEEIVKIAFDGLKLVVVYTLVATMITKKENTFTAKMTARFLENSTFGIFTAVGMFALSILAIVLLIILGCTGYGVVAWPVLIVYVALLLLSLSICKLVVGLVLYEILKKKIGKYRIPALIGIFAVLFAITKIPYIAIYMGIAINVMSMAVIMTYIFKRNETSEFMQVEEKETEKIEDKKEENVKEEVKVEEEKKETKK